MINMPVGSGLKQKESVLRKYWPIACGLLLLIAGSFIVFTNSESSDSSLRGFTNSPGEIDLDQISADENIVKVTVTNLDGENGSEGEFHLKINSSWAPLGAEQFMVSLSVLVHVALLQQSGRNHICNL